MVKRLFHWSVARWISPSNLTASKPLVQLERAGCYSSNHATVNCSIYVYNIYIYIYTYIQNYIHAHFTIHDKNTTNHRGFLLKMLAVTKPPRKPSKFLQVPDSPSFSSAVTVTDHRNVILHRNDQRILSQRIHQMSQGEGNHMGDTKFVVIHRCRRCGQIIECL